MSAVQCALLAHYIVPMRTDARGCSVLPMCWQCMPKSMHGCALCLVRALHGFMSAVQPCVAGTRRRAY
eukprot:1361517-Alexandrium_andersonii.AAC.1